MSLTIDEEKVRESLKVAPKVQYVVTVSHLVSTVPDAQVSSSSISGAIMFAAQSNTVEARKHLLSLRRRIEESGTPLKTQEELDGEIDETRGRKDF